MSRVIFLKPVVHAGAVYSEGDCIQMEDATAMHLAKAGLLTIQAGEKASETETETERSGKKTARKSRAKK